MTITQAQTMIEQFYTLKEGSDKQECDEMLLSLCYGIRKKDELEMIKDYIADANKAGYSKKQAVQMVQFRFAKSKRRAYELVKESGAYD